VSCWYTGSRASGSTQMLLVGVSLEACLITIYR
jgi:hypothetical protein